MTILLLDNNQTRKDKVQNSIRRALPGLKPRFESFAQHDVFGQLPHKPYAAAFIWIGGMLDIEATRQLVRTCPEVPAVIVSDSEEYGLESYNIGLLKYYLLYPVDEAELRHALELCGLIKKPDIPGLIPATHR